jgi:general secretion pathway protein A
MYNQYYNFSCSPFENTLDQRFLYISEGHEEVIAALLYFAREKKGFALVCGDVGTGKTMIVHYFLEKLPPTVQPILIPYPEVGFIEIVRYIARIFKIDLAGKLDLEVIEEVKAALAKASGDGRQVVLIIDEAHLLSSESLEDIRLLSNIELSESKLLQILLIGQNELSLKLRKSGMRQLRQRININRVLSPMSEKETVEYIDHRLKVAGADFDRCFEPGCSKPIYEMTGGVPRSINRLCDTALLICMTEKGDKVTRRVLKKAHRALESDSILVPETPRQLFPIHLPDADQLRFHIRRILPAAAIVLLLGIGAFEYWTGDVSQHGVRVFGHGARQEVNKATEERQTSAFEAKVPDNPHSRVGENASPGGLQPPAESAASDSRQGSSGTIFGEAPAVKKIDEDATAENTISPPGGEAEFESSSQPAPENKENRGADKSFLQAQPAGDGDIRDTGKSEPADSASSGAEETASEDTGFFIVKVKKGESLSRIAAQWFPQDPIAGIEAILAANPQIRDRNLILESTTLRVPRSL